MNPDEFENWQAYRQDDEEAQRLEMFPRVLQAIRDLAEYCQVGEFGTDATPDPNFDKWFLAICRIAPLE
jgi:hypothetical protein